MTDLRLCRIHRPTCWAASTASMGCRATSNRRGIIAVPMALLPTEAGQGQNMTPTFPVDRHSALRIAAALVGIAAVLGACTHTDEVTTATVPDDYRLTHPIAIQ